MKTTYTLTLLALTIQVMVSGQTQDSQIRKIRMDISGASPETTNDGKQPVTQNTYALQLEENLKESDNLKTEQQKLKNDILAAQQKLTLKHIEISEIKSKITYEQYTLNITTIEDLLKQASLKPATVQKTETLSKEAEIAIKMAKEIREEARAQLTPDAQLAEMSNAEEKEVLAISKQKEAIHLLSRSRPLYIKENNPEFNNKTVLVQAYPKAVIPAPVTFAGNVTVIHTNVTAINTDLSELIKQSTDLKNTCEQLRTAADTKQGNEKNVLLNEAALMEQEYIAKQISISLIHYKTNSQTFYSNRLLIEQLLNSVENEDLTSNALQINNEAEYLFRMAKEMREEADAQLTENARLGEMSNAEEKELIALNKQQDTFNELRKLNKKMLLASN